ncbi:10173_t:CDS:2 [Diversispora eburnea]|uniref:10173_t:CDS:1 n=1 Tax=Diversispora eburnea TaxID=1213867 RepID=A0A9N8WBE8_9GLOM|nr:10173_t:CDS:2 [Diversispora eburnea]
MGSSSSSLKNHHHEYVNILLNSSSTNLKSSSDNFTSPSLLTPPHSSISLTKSISTRIKSSLKKSNSSTLSNCSQSTTYNKEIIERFIGGEESDGEDGGDEEYGNRGGIPFPNNTFDFIHIQNSSLNFTEQQWRNQVLPEMIRVTKIGGWIELCEVETKIINMPLNFTKLYDAPNNSKGINLEIVPHLGDFNHKLETLLHYEHGGAGKYKQQSRLYDAK